VLTRSGSSTILAAEEGRGGQRRWSVVGSSYNRSVGERRLVARRQARGPLRFLKTGMDLFESFSDDFGKLHVAL